MFAIVTPNLSAVAETYIRQHIREIAPGKTAVVCFQNDHASPPSVPVMTLSNERQNDLPWLIKRSIGIYNIFHWGYAGVLNNSEQKKLTSFFKEHRIKTVLAEFGPMGCTILPTCVANEINLFVYFHGHDATSLARGWYYRNAYRQLAKKAAGIFCTSQYLEEKLLDIGIPKHKIHVVPCGIETHKYQPSHDHDPNLIMAVGRFTEKKAPHLTIEAFAKVVESLPGARLEMIGDGALLKRCKQLAEKLNIRENIIFHGAKNHDFVMDKLQKASVFMQHSVTAPNGDTESLGISLLEAMSLEVPVVVTRHNGFVTTVRHEETGFLVDEYNIEEMAGKVTELLKNKTLRQRMGKAGRKWVENQFSAASQTTKLRNVMGL